jgi:hypothetical protein
MAQKGFYQLILDITANSAKLSTGLAKSNREIDGTNKKASSLGKTLKDVFKEASSYIDKVIPGFSKFSSKVLDSGKSVTTFSGTLKILKIALASTGIGLLVVALGSLISYFKNTDAGADKFAKALNAIKSVISAVTKRISMLGEAITLLLKGDFKEAAAKAKEAFSDLGDEIKSTYKAGLDLGERKNKLEDDQIALIRRQADERDKIAELELLAYDKSKDAKAREDALNESIEIRKGLAEEEYRLAKEHYDILTQQNALGDNLDKDNQAEAEAYAEMVDKRTKLNEELRSTLKLQNTLRKELAEESRELAAANLERQKAIDLTPVSISSANIALPSLAPTIDTTSLAKVAPNAATASDALAKLFEDVESFNTMPDPFGFLTHSLDTLTNKLSEGAKSFKEYGRNILSTIKSIVAGFLAEAVAAMISNAIKTAAKTGPLALLLAPALAAAGAGVVKTAFNTLIPGFANGTSFAPGGLALVGERGPELVNLPRGSQVYNSRLTQSALSGEVIFHIRGTELVGVLDKQNKINRSY